MLSHAVVIITLQYLNIQNVLSGIKTGNNISDLILMTINNPGRTVWLRFKSQNTRHFPSFYLDIIAMHEVEPITNNCRILK